MRERERPHAEEAETVREVEGYRLEDGDEPLDPGRKAAIAAPWLGGCLSPDPALAARESFRKSPEPLLENETEQGNAETEGVEPRGRRAEDGANAHADGPPEEKGSGQPGLREEGLARLSRTKLVDDVDDEPGRVDDDAEGERKTEKDQDFVRAALGHQGEEAIHGDAEYSATQLSRERNEGVLESEEGAGEEAHKRGAYPAGDSYRGEDPPGRECGDEAEVQCAGAEDYEEALAQVAEHDGEEKHEEAAHEERRVNAAVRWGPEGEHHSFEARYEGPALEQDGYFLAPVSNALDFARSESPEGDAGLGLLFKHPLKLSGPTLPAPLAASL